jgi:hypothetical protein
MKQTIKLNERQLRNIIRESIGEILNEGMFESRPRKTEKPSYWEIEDYREVPGTELYVYNPRGCANKNHRTPEGVKNALKANGALRAYIDKDGGVHAFFYSGSWPKFVELGNAWDEDAWYEMMQEPTMKGIAKQRTVKLNDYVPGFDEIWAKSLQHTKQRKEQSRREEEGQFGGRSRSRDAATAYNTVPTIGTI